MSMQLPLELRTGRREMRKTQYAIKEVPVEAVRNVLTGKGPIWDEARAVCRNAYYRDVHGNLRRISPKLSKVLSKKERRHGS
jgi:hypothetical protein